MVKKQEIYTVSRPVEDYLNVAERAEWRKLESEMRALNERGTRREQAVRFICRHQSAFLISGDAADLAPLSQGEIAVAIGCDRARVHRLLFDDDRKDESKAHRRKSNEYRETELPWFLITPRGRVYLRDLLCVTDDVVVLIAEKYPEWSDNQIRQYLGEHFGRWRSRQAIQQARNRGQQKSLLAS